MSLSLQPAITASPLNGLPAQPVDSAAPQPLSFGEVLKVEEKKLQQEQETNAQSVAALLATIQPPAITPSIRGFDAGTVVEPAQSDAQAALTTDSAQSTATQPRQNLQIHNQQVALPEKAAAKTQTNFSMPVPEVEETDQHQPSKTQPAPQPKEVKTAVIGETQYQTAQPIAENRFPAPTSVSNTQAASTPKADAEKTVVKTSVHKDESSSTSTQPSETKFAPELTRTAEKVGKPNLSQTNLSIASTDAPNTRPSTSNVIIQNESTPLANKTQQAFVVDAKPVETDQENAPAFETPQPAAKTQSETPPVSLKREVETGSYTQKATITSSSQNETPLPERADTLQSDRVMPETTQTKVTITEISQPVSKTNIRAEKSISLDGVKESQTKPVSANNGTESGDHFKNAILSNDSSPSAAETQQAFPQNERVKPEVSSAEKGSEIAQPVELPEVPSSKVIHSTKINLASVEDTEMSVQQKPFVEDVKSTPSTNAHAPAEKIAVTIKSDMQFSAAVKMDTPVHANIPEDENSQPVQETVAPNVKLTLPTISNEPATTEMTTAVPAQADTFTSEISRSAKAKIVPSTIKSATPEIDNRPMPAEEKITAPVQANILETETSQPVKEAIAPAMKSAAPEISNEPETGNIPTSEKPQPVKEAVVRNVKPASVENTNDFSATEIKNATRAQIEVLESETPKSAKETFAPNAKSVQSAQTDIPVAEVSMPAKETIVQTVKSAVSEVNNTLSKSDAKGIVQAISEIPASENSQPTKKLVSPSAETTSVQADALANEEPQPARQAATQTVKSATPDLRTAGIKGSTSAQADIYGSEKPQPSKETFDPQVKSAASAQTEIPVHDILQPAKEVDVLTVKSDVPAQMDVFENLQPVKDKVAPNMKSAALEDGNEPVTTEARVIAQAPAKVPANKVPQPTHDAVAATSKAVVSNVSNEVGIVETKMITSDQMDIPTAEMSRPDKKIVATEVRGEASVTEENMATPSADVSDNEISQPVKEKVTPNVKSAMPERGNEPDATKTKMATVAQAEIPVSDEVPQPVKETVAPAVKSVTPDINAEIHAPETKTNMPVREKADPVKGAVAPSIKADIPVHASNPVDETPQPVKETVPTSIKPVAIDFQSEQHLAEAKVNTSVQVKVSVNEIPLPVTEMSQPVVTTVHLSDSGDSEVPQPIASAVGLVEAEEAVLKNKDGKAAPSLDVENAAAESRLGGTNRPQIKNEAFVVEQKNAPAEIKPERVLQSARVEIESDEKVTAKEPALDLESNVVIAGIDKGIAGTDVVKKSSVAQVDPMAREVVEQITSQMKTRIKSGETSIRVKLNPEKLGEIEVQMTHSAKGVSVSFITEQASTGQLIESQVNQLRQSLKDAGVQLVNLNISQHGQSYQEGGGFRQSQQFVQTSRRDVPLVEADEGIQPQRVGQISEIDYLV